MSQVRIITSVPNEGAATREVVYEIYIEYRTGEAEIIAQRMAEAGVTQARYWDTSGYWYCDGPEEAKRAYQVAKSILADLDAIYAQRVAAQEAARRDVLNVAIIDQLLDLYHAGKLYIQDRGIKRLRL